MTSEQFEELKAIQDAYLEMANKRQEEPLEEAVGGFGSHYSKAEKEKEMSDDHKGEKETSYRSKSPKRSGFSALDRLKAKQGIKEEEVSADRKIGKDGRKIPARRIVDKDSKDYVRIVDKDSKDYVKEEEVVESERSDKYKTIVSSLDRMRAKATANAELQKLQKQNKDHKKLPEEVEEEVEELDEVSMSTLDSYRKKAFAEPGHNRQAGRELAYDKSSSHGDSKVKSSEEIDVAKSQIKDLIKPEHHSKYPISKITSMTHGRKIYNDASAAGHLKEEVEELDEI